MRVVRHVLMHNLSDDGPAAEPAIGALGAESDGVSVAAQVVYVLENLHAHVGLGVVYSGS